MTLGYYGTRKATERVKEIEEKRKITLSGEVLNLMFLVPVIGGLTVGANAIIGPIKIIGEYGEFGVFVTEIISYFFYCFAAFTFLHMLLASSILQHSRNLTTKEKLLILVFGAYALDWNHLANIKPEEPDPDAPGQRR